MRLTAELFLKTACVRAVLNDSPFILCAAQSDLIRVQDMPHTFSV